MLDGAPDSCSASSGKSRDSGENTFLVSRSRPPRRNAPCHRERRNAALSQAFGRRKACGPIGLGYVDGMKSKALMLALGLPLLPIAAQAQQSSENVRVMGANVPARGGAFVPVGSQLACVAIDAGRGWDGKKWHALYPIGPRQYAVPTSNEVACVVIAGSDCWTGSAWYRLPSGQILGRTPGKLRGAFVTTPLQP